MWRALSRLSESKPLVVSMSGVAASGGYFVSGIKGAPIFALGSTLTGSIGVVGGKFDARGLYDLVGVKKEIVQRGRRAAYWSDYTAMDDDAFQKLDADIDAHYRAFVTKMAEGRGRTYAELDAVAQGRVWTGCQALENGLVDTRGGLIQAFAKVRELLGLGERAPLSVTTQPAERRRFPVRLEWKLPEAVADIFRPEVSAAAWLARERILSLLPFDIRFR
jgi:protease-4